MPGNFDVGGIEARLGAKVDQRGFREFDAYMAKADAKEAHAEIKVDVDKRGFADADRHLANISSKVDDLGGHIGRFNRNFRFFGNLWKTFKWPVIIAGAATATQAIATLTAGMVAMTAAATPLLGLLTAYPTALGVLGQAAGVVALAGISDLTQALGGNEEALKRLTPEARRFMDTLKGFQPQYDKLRESVQRPLFRGLESGLRSAMHSFEPFRKGMQRTSEVMGGLADRAGKLVGSKGFGRDLGQIMKTNANVLQNVGKGALSAFSGLRHILVAARPLSKWLGQLAADAGKWVNQSAKAGRESGGLARFFDRTRKAAEGVGKALGDTFSILFNIGRAGAPVGGRLWGGIADELERINKLTSSREGQRGLSKFFSDAEPALKELGRLLRDVAKALFDVGTQPGFAEFVKAVRTDLLPILAAVLKSSLALATPLVHLTGALADFLQPLLGASGPLVAFVNGLTAVVKFLDKIADSVPGINQAAIGLGSMGLAVSSLGAALGAINFARKISELIGFRRGLRGIANVFGKESGGQLARDWLGGITGGIRRGGGRVRRVIGDIFRGAKNVVVNVASDLASWVTNTMAGRIRGRAGRIRSALRTALSAARNALVGAATALGDVIASTMAGRMRRSGRWQTAGTRSGRLFGRFFAAAAIIAFTPLIREGLNKILSALGVDNPDVNKGLIENLTGGAVSPPTPGEIVDTLNPFNHQAGGMIGRRRRRFRQPHGRGRDTELRLLDPEEFVMRREAVQKIGVGRLNIANLGMNASIPQMQSGGLVGRTGGGGRRSTDLGQEEVVKKTKKMREEVGKEWRKLDADQKKTTGGVKARARKDFEGMASGAVKQTERLKDGVGKDFDGVSARIKKSVDGARQKAGDAFGKMAQTGKEKSGNLVSNVSKSMGDLDDALFKGLGYIGAATNKALSAFDAKPLDYSVPKPPGLAGGGYLYGQGRDDTIPLILGMAAPGEAILNAPQQLEAEYALAITKALGLGQYGSLDELFGAGMRHYAEGGKIAPMDLVGPVPYELPAQGGINDVRREANKYIRKHSGGQVYQVADRMDRLHQPYLWGGGHGATADPNGPWDCSGAVSALLAYSIVPNFTPTVSGGFMGMFQPGRDPDSLNILANTEHVYAVIPKPGGGLRAWGTSDSNPGGGLGWIDDYLFRGGFADRHVPLDGLSGARGGRKGRGDAKVPGFAGGGRFGPGSGRPPAVGDVWLKDVGGNWDANEVFTGIRQLGGGRTAASQLSSKVYGESTGNPRAVGHDPGGTTGLGLLQITTHWNDDIIAKYGGRGAMFNPWTNLRAALDVYGRGGIGQWYAPSTGPGHLLIDRIRQAKPKPSPGKPGGGGGGAPLPNVAANPTDAQVTKAKAILANRKKHSPTQIAWAKAIMAARRAFNQGTGTGAGDGGDVTDGAEADAPDYSEFEDLVSEWQSFTLPETLLTGFKSPNLPKFTSADLAFAGQNIGLEGGGSFQSATSTARGKISTLMGLAAAIRQSLTKLQAYGSGIATNISNIINPPASGGTPGAPALRMGGRLGRRLRRFWGGGQIGSSGLAPVGGTGSALAPSVPGSPGAPVPQTTLESLAAQLRPLLVQRDKMVTDLEGAEQKVLDYAGGPATRVSELSLDYLNRIRTGLKIQRVQRPILGQSGSFAAGGRVGGAMGVVERPTHFTILVEDGAVDGSRIHAIAESAAAAEQRRTARRVARGRQFPAAPGKVASYGGIAATGRRYG